MIPDTSNGFFNSLPQDLQALYDWSTVIGDEAYNLVCVASELNLGNPEDFQTIVDEMDTQTIVDEMVTIKDKLTALKNVVRNLNSNKKERQSK